ncbi:30S ribosomal protein S20 [candidate division WWE3 bacterium]|uniref:Small ribosomal subunit protein bS20 n=1 Tax=candidate division WWE3 bacterium TaxID=2053526 RepID=A0A955LKN9_UNCKA|nr:30S ribosomal protein S20 [candidate division WWE3 bacterium]
MPNTSSAKKALRQSTAKRQVNLRVIHAYKDAIRTFMQKPVAENLNIVFSKVDKAVKRHVIHKNKAARIKSRLSQHPLETNT